LDLHLEGNSVLDIGCYDGFLLSHVNASEKIGIDLKTLKEYPNIQYIQSNFLSYNFKNKKFDKIFSFDVLEHVKEDDLFLKKVVELLDENGTAILSTPSDKISIFPSFFQLYVDKRWGHIYRRGYSKDKIIQLLSDCEKTNLINVKFVEWNCPIFRFIYLPLNLTWKIFPELAKIIFHFFMQIDLIFKKGQNGFLFIIIKKGKQ
jgi:SAM-dependent methyltransferase